MIPVCAMAPVNPASLKLKRAVVMKEFAADVDALYAGGKVD